MILLLIVLSIKMVIRSRKDREGYNISCHWKYLLLRDGPIICQGSHFTLRKYPQVWYNQSSGYIWARFIYILYYVFFCALVMLAGLNMFSIKKKSLKMVVSGVCCWRICVKFSHPWVTPSQIVFLQKYLAVDTAKCKNLSFTADSAPFVELYHFSCQYVPTEKRSLEGSSFGSMSFSQVTKWSHKTLKHFEAGVEWGGTVSTPSIVSRYRMESNATSVDILYQVIQA